MITLLSQEEKEREAAAKRAMERAAEEYAQEAAKLASVSVTAPKAGQQAKVKSKTTRTRAKKKQNPEDDFWVRASRHATLAWIARTLDLDLSSFCLFMASDRCQNTGLASQERLEILHKVSTFCTQMNSSFSTILHATASLIRAKDAINLCNLAALKA